MATHEGEGSEGSEGEGSSETPSRQKGLMRDSCMQSAAR